MVRIRAAEQQIPFSSLPRHTSSKKIKFLFQRFFCNHQALTLMVGNFLRRQFSRLWNWLERRTRKLRLLFAVHVTFFV